MYYEEFRKSKAKGVNEFHYGSGHGQGVLATIGSHVNGLFDSLQTSQGVNRASSTL